MCCDESKNDKQPQKCARGHEVRSIIMKIKARHKMTIYGQNIIKVGSFDVFIIVIHPIF